MFSQSAEKREYSEVWGLSGAATLLTNGIVAGTAAAVGLLASSNRELYLRIAQEDDFIEWASFWALMLAMVAFFLSAKRRWQENHRLPWFLVGVGVFCFLFAMEEISWGQRVFGYRPPTYFLEHNFQQELNVHNVLGKSLRKLTLKGIILGYGVLLPLVALSKQGGKILARLGVVAPSVVLLPAFLLTYLIYEIYPWKLSGEVVELMLGFCFLFAGLQSGPSFAVLSISSHGSRLRSLMPFLVASGLVVALGIANGYTSRAQRQGHPETLEAARTEVETLQLDFQSMARGNGGRLVTKCGLHKRLYTYVEQYGRESLLSGAFASLTAQGLPEDRADFFLDPWNSPYWIRHECSREPRSIVVFVYSFGPNRLRDSSEWEILGDDIGSVISEVGAQNR